jgi:DNA-binding beta-propeller fold protein YncE
MANPHHAAGHHRTRSFAYVVSGTVAACAVTPVDTVSDTAGSPIVIGGGAQSIVVTPNGKTIYVHNGVLNRVTILSGRSRVQATRSTGVRCPEVSRPHSLPPSPTESAAARSRRAPRRRELR